MQISWPLDASLASLRYGEIYLTIAQELIESFRHEVYGAKKVLVGTHLNPDGDALGSALAMALYLDQIGVECEVLCHHSAPRNMRYLPTVDRVQQAPKSEGYDLGIIVDLDSLERLGDTAPYFSALPKTIVIDHHVPHDKPGDVRIIETTAAATALILSHLFTELGAEITPDMATCLYTGIVTDTGSFRFRNTSPDALHQAANLLQHGADFVRVSEEVFQSKQLSSARLLGHLLETMKLSDHNQLAWGSLSNRDFDWAKAKDEDTEGFVNELLSIETVQIAAIFREPVLGKVRCSIRSRGGYDVAEVARVFGGGGHKNAAGCTFETSLDEAEALVVSEMRKCLVSV